MGFKIPKLNVAGYRELIDAINSGKVKNLFRGRNAVQARTNYLAALEDARRNALLETYKGDPIAGQLTYDQLGISDFWPNAIDPMSTRPLTAYDFDGNLLVGRQPAKVSGRDIALIENQARAHNDAIEKGLHSEGVRTKAEDEAKRRASAVITERKANAYDAKHAKSKVSAGVHQGAPFKPLQLEMGYLKLGDFEIKPRGYQSNLNRFKQYIRGLVDEDGSLSRYTKATDAQLEQLFFENFNKYFDHLTGSFIGGMKFGGVLNYLEYLN